jgi:hypothetical protein
VSNLPKIIDLLRAQDADGREGVDWKIADVALSLKWGSVLYANEDRSIVVKARPEVHHPDGTHVRGEDDEDEWHAFSHSLEDILEDLVGNQRWDVLRWLRDEIDKELIAAPE